MALIADGLLIAAAIAAAFYCHVLALRLRRLRDMDGGVGAAIAALSGQVEEMRAALAAARAVSGESARALSETTARAEIAAGRLELLLAALHDRDGARPLDLAARRSAKAATDEAMTARRRRLPETQSMAAEAWEGMGARYDQPSKPTSAEPSIAVAERPREERPPAESMSAGVDLPRPSVAAGGRGEGEAAALRSALEALAREGDR